MTTPLDATTASVCVSVITSTKYNASKRLIADLDGLPMDDPLHKQGIASGRVQVREVQGLAGLRDLLARLTPKQAIVHGIPKGSAPGDVFALMIAALYKGDPRTIARTKECIAYPAGAFVLMLDYDHGPAAAVQVTDAATILEHLATCWPVFAEVGYLVTTSTRSAIRPKGQPDTWLVEPRGMHIYIVVTGDVARFKELLTVRLWGAGLGFCKLATANAHTGVAAMLERALLDLTVFSPERLDYVAGAIIPKNAPFYQDRPAPVLHDGIVLDLDALPDVTDAERQEYARRLETAKAALRPQQREAVRRAITQQAPDMPEEERERTITQRLEQAERGELASDHPLFFANGTQLLAQELQSAKKLDGRRLSDPIEPTYGPDDAVFHWRNGDWRIVSWAHGVQKTYTLAQQAPAPPPDDDTADLLDRADQQGEHTGSDLPPRFHMDKTGLWYTPPREADGTQPPKILVCAPLHVVAATRDEDNNNHGHLLEFHDRHNHPQQWAMPLELLEDQREYRRVFRRLGLRIRGATRALLQEYLEEIDVKARARCVARVGWHGGAYILPGATLGNPGGERLVLQNLDQTSEGYRQAGTLDGWRDEVGARCIGNSRLLLAVSTGFAATLLGPLEEESGGTQYRGSSSEGKTTALVVAGSVWGEPGRLENWRATANGLEGVALGHNDNLLCLDELKQVDPREAGSVAYMLANGVGKRRGQAHGGVRARLTWRLLFLSTGELSLEQHIAEAGQRIQAGQEVRMADIPADAGKGYGLFETLHGSPTGQAFAETLKTQVGLHYGHAGRAFVARVAADLQGTVRQLRTLIDACVQQMLPSEALGQVYRVARRFALIGAAGELATAYGLTGWPEGEAAAAAQRCFQDWLRQRGGEGNTDEERALAQVRLYFEKYGTSRFEPWREGADGITCQRCHGTGLVNNSYAQGVCFTCNGTKVIMPDHPAIRLIQVRAGWSKATDDGGTEFFVQKEVFRQEIARGYDGQWLCRVLRSREYLLPAASGKNIRSESVPGRRSTPVYRITATLLGAQRPGEKGEEEEETEM